MTNLSKSTFNVYNGVGRLGDRKPCVNCLQCGKDPNIKNLTCQIDDQEPEEYQEPPLLSPDINKGYGGVDDTFDEIVNAIALALAQYARDFLQTKSQFRLRQVTPIVGDAGGRFVYDFVNESGEMRTYRAKWYLLNGVPTIDMSQQTLIQTMSESGEEPHLLINKY